MILIEIDEFSNWLILLILLLVLYFAFISTYVREDRSPSTAVLVIENNLRRLNRIPQPVLRSPSQQSNESNTTEQEELDIENDSIASSIDNITQSILTEASESAILNLSDSEAYNNRNREEADVGVEDLGPEEIIREMDRDLEPAPPAEGIRHRRTVIDKIDKKNNECPETSKLGEENVSRQIRIKLKYLNDELKLVEGYLNEVIGDFKKRNFTLELAAQKHVRLVFNGHVLQPDSKTLAACGLFDNCVIHCLIHNPKPETTQQQQQESGIDPQNEEEPIGMGAHNHTNEATHNNIPRYGSYFIYIGTFVMSLTILFCWYCRFQYGHLFNLNATIGLILTTTIFLIMMPSIILVDSDNNRE